MFEIVDEINAKGKESRGKERAAQGEMPWVGPVKDPQAAPLDFLSRASWDGVLRYCVQMSGKDDYEVADEIHVSHGTMSKILKGTAGLWGARLVTFMRRTESIAPLQWLADQMGCDVVRRAPLETEVERLKRENAEQARQIEDMRRGHRRA
jgi:hypothetical protein